MVPVAVDVDAAAGQVGQDAAAAGGDRRGGQAGGGRAGPGGGDDRAAGSGERDLAGVDGLAGALALSGRDGDGRGGPGHRAGQFDGYHPGGVLLSDQVRGLGAEHRPGAGPGAADRGLGFLKGNLRSDPPPVVGGGQGMRRVGIVVVQVSDQAEQLGASRPATATVYSMTRTVRVFPPPQTLAR